MIVIYSLNKNLTITGKKVNINSKSGSSILRKYIKLASD
jgi:hypothetical protein